MRRRGGVWFCVTDDLVGAVFVGPPGSGRDLGRVIQAGMDLRPALDALRQGQIEALKSVVESTNALQLAQASSGVQMKA